MTPDDDGATLPETVVETAADLPRRARRGAEGARAEREALLAEHGFAATVREDTLVLHPSDWLDGETVDPDAIDTDDAVEVPLDGGDWSEVAAYNRAVADRVRERHGDPHGATAEAFAAYMNNHHATRIDAATPRQIETFRDDYFRRNAWPSEAQRVALGESIELIYDVADAVDDSAR
jgi:hypothetical protein